MFQLARWDGPQIWRGRRRWRLRALDAPGRPALPEAGRRALLGQGVWVRV